MEPAVSPSAYAPTLDLLDEVPDTLLALDAGKSSVSCPRVVAARL